MEEVYNDCRLTALYTFFDGASHVVASRVGVLTYTNGSGALIHRSAWNRNSRKFAPLAQALLPLRFSSSC